MPTVSATQESNVGGSPESRDIEAAVNHEKKKNKKKPHLSNEGEIETGKLDTHESHHLVFLVFVSVVN